MACSRAAGCLEWNMSQSGWTKALMNSCKCDMRTGVHHHVCWCSWTAASEACRQGASYLLVRMDSCRGQLLNKVWKGPMERERLPAFPSVTPSQVLVLILGLHALAFASKFSSPVLRCTTAIACK
eukprot:1136435-Pelagomonas_calceolata.AAC.1